MPAFLLFIVQQLYLCDMQRSFTDQLNRTVTLRYPPKRIISLEPSQTELLCDLGIESQIVGVTMSCVHPIEKFAERTKVGGKGKLNIDIIKGLEPDLIIGNREGISEANLELLSAEFPVWMSDVSTLEEAIDGITQIGTLVDRQPEAAYLNYLINAGFSDLQTLALQMGINKTVAYLIRKTPYRAAGTGTFTHDLLVKNGLTNVIREDGYPGIDLDALITLKPDLILLSSEPYAFEDGDVQDLKKAIPEAKVMIVDGEMFSWYGSRLVKAVQYLFELQKELVF